MFPFQRLQLGSHPPMVSFPTVFLGWVSQIYIDLVRLRCPLAALSWHEISASNAQNP